MNRELRTGLHPSGRSEPGVLAAILSVRLRRGLLLADGTEARGLILRVSGGPAARVLITAGKPWAGSEDTRTCTVTNTGVWLSIAGWTFVKVEVVGVGSASTFVEYAWTSDQSPGTVPLLFIETLQGAATSVPRGARTLTPAAADAGFLWRTDQDGAGGLDVPVALAAGVETPVKGARYVLAGGAIVGCWTLDPL